MRGLRVAGIVIIFLGVALILNSGIFLTGLVIANGDTGSLGYLVRGGGFIGAILMLIGGTLLFEARRKKN